MAASQTGLEKGYEVLALKLQEASMMHSDVRSLLSDAVSKAHKGTGSYGYYVNHDGDGDEGNCVYACDGELYQCPYSISGRSGKAPEADLDTDNARGVVSTVSYKPKAEDEDHYTSMDEAFRKDGLYTDLPIYERFISAKARKAADSSSFAGKGRSFPILKPEDVSAALHSIGRAGSDNYDSATIRRNIKRIAKAKGFALPDSLKDDGDKESWKPKGTLLVESALFLEAPRLKEGATADYPIKLIAPGRGSSGYYTPEVLKKASESNIFKAGTQMFWNHDTDSQEAERPEGDLDRLAAVTTTDAKWEESGRDGPGLYARAKVFSDYADRVKEKGPHIGLSIRAGGERDEAATAPDGKRRVVTALNNARSVDFVTKAGRDGKVFTEAKVSEGDDMDKNEVQALITESLAPVLKENALLKGRLAVITSPQLIHEALEGVRLPERSKRRVMERVAMNTPISEDGSIDQDKLKKMVEAEAKAEVALLVELGLDDSIAGVGTRLSEAEMKRERKDIEEEREKVSEALTDIFVGPKLSKGGDETARRARKDARKAFQEGWAA